MQFIIYNSFIKTLNLINLARNLKKMGKIKNFIERIKIWIKETERILRLIRKPKRSEFDEVARITGLGIILFGLIGFIIFFIAQLIRML